jgi:two-component system response regulator FixJ
MNFHVPPALTGHATTGEVVRPPEAGLQAANLVVHIVDDDEAVSRSLALLLGSLGMVTRTYDCAEALLDQIDTIAPGCLVVDVRMPGMDGLELQMELQERGCTMPVVVVTGHADVGLAVKAMKAGALDFIEKPYSEEELLRAVRTALARHADDRHVGVMTEAARARIAVLTPREREVLGRLVEGRPNKVIAHELGISPRTVEIHRANMMEKLGCRSLAEAVRVAIAAQFQKL